MHVISLEFEIRYIVTPQPITGFDSYSPLQDEKDMWYRYKQRLVVNGVPYNQNLLTISHAAQALFQKTPYRVSCIDIFLGNQVSPTIPGISTGRDTCCQQTLYSANFRIDFSCVRPKLGNPI